MIGHLVAMLVSAVAFFGAILLYGAFSPRRLKGWKFWLCFAVYCALMEGAGPLANGLYSACGILGGGVGRQTLYNVTRYLLLYVLLFRERSMVYLSTTVIFYSWMDNRKMAEEIVRLVGACHGHALVLFTSYRQMAEVRALTDGQWQYPTYQAWRNGGRVIQQFKESGNGVLFAAGSCWEGIDFPGDMVSLLIIAKLPFPIPDPVSDYERRQYPNLRDYINAEIIPEMQKKLRQGFGRAIRTEQDSCVVAILDERAAIGGKYHDAALAALPSCPTTEKIEDVQQFIREQKRPDYFL